MILPIDIVSYRYGELTVSLWGGKNITIKDVNDYEYNKIRVLLSHKNYKEVKKILTNLYNLQSRRDLGITPVEDSMLDQAEKEGILSPKKKLF